MGDERLDFVAALSLSVRDSKSASSVDFEVTNEF